jgi:hypothetical protein
MSLQSLARARGTLTFYLLTLQENLPVPLPILVDGLMDSGGGLVGRPFEDDFKRSGNFTPSMIFGKFFCHQAFAFLRPSTGLKT